MNTRNINFFSEETNFQPKKKDVIRKWVIETIQLENFDKLGPLNFIFCGDEFLLNMNKSYLQHNTYTDIITFDNSTKESEISGDIFISVDRISENASKYKVPFNEELHRVIVHGVLHLCGYLDKSTTEKSVMRSKEDKFLSLLKTL